MINHSFPSSLAYYCHRSDIYLYIEYRFNQINWMAKLYTTNRYCEPAYIIIIFLFFSILFAFSGLQNVYGVKLLSKVEKPFGVSYDDWVAKYWNWDVGMSTDQFTPKPNGCIINNSSSMAMLVETSVEGSPQMVCSISYKQGIIIPLWIGWCDTPELKRFRSPSSNPAILD